MQRTKSSPREEACGGKSLGSITCLSSRLEQCNKNRSLEFYSAHNICLEKQQNTVRSASLTWPSWLTCHKPSWRAERRWIPTPRVEEVVAFPWTGSPEAAAAFVCDLFTFCSLKTVRPMKWSSSFPSPTKEQVPPLHIRCSHKKSGIFYNGLHYKSRWS